MNRLAPAADDARRGKFLYWLMYTPAVIEPAYRKALEIGS